MVMIKPDHFRPPPRVWSYTGWIGSIAVAACTWGAACGWVISR
jgi:hypothetical protein